jgi:zinc dependent phospholipase C
VTGRLLLILVLLCVVPRPAAAYAVLAHEASIDANWDSAIEPLLKRRFPRASETDLLRARSFAYGGSVIQDLGYYPFGSRFFSNLLHYVRSGDFVEAMLRDASDLDQLAFAIGALAHYADDNTGHPEAVNRAVPLVFPKLERKFGNEVTYVQAPAQHVMVEFSFDVVQAAGGTYLPEAYQSFIGFRVATPLLERAFHDTYGLEMRDVFADMDRSISTYRYSVSQLIPALTEAAWRDKHDEIVKLHPSLEKTGFVFAYGRQAFEREYGTDYQRPGWFARFIAWIYRIIPKFGPLKPLSFKTPTPEADALFARSFRDSSARLRASLRQLGTGHLELDNTNFDTGLPARHGIYALADDTYADWMRRHAQQKFRGVTTPIRANVGAFYGDRPEPSPLSRTDRRHWKRVMNDFHLLMKSGTEG